MRTQEMLAQLPEKNRDYLKLLKENIRMANERNLESIVKEQRALARGYIKGLVDCGVIDDFKTAWCWFTL